MDYVISQKLPDLFSYVKIHLLFADSFRKLGNYKFATFCLNKAAEQRNLLLQLRHSTVQAAGYSIPGVIVLLHEMAHVALAGNDHYRNDWFTFISRTIDSFTRQLLSIVDDRDIQRLEALTGMNFSAEEGDDYFKKLSEMMGAFAANGELNEEITCDLYAALAFINLKAPVDFLDSTAHESLPLTLQELGDTFYRAVCVLTNMQTIIAIRAIGDNITYDLKTETIGKELGELSLRQNILIYALTLVYDHILAHVRLEKSEDQRFDNLTYPEKQGLLLKSIKFYNGRRDELFLTPPANTIRFFYNDPWLNKNDHIRQKGADFPDFERYDELRSAIYGN